MEQQTTATIYSCPNCGAPLTLDPESGSFKCDFCQSAFTEAELAATDARERAEREAKEAEDFCSHMQEYFCPNCGASIAADEETAADFCVYCQSPIVLRGKLAGELKPTKVIPFAIDKEEAERRFLAFAKKKWFLPRGIFAKGKMENMRGVYYPFWVADADTRSAFFGKATKVRSWVAGDYRYTETSHFNIERKGDIHFEDVTMSALSSEDKGMLEGILPYPSEALVDFSMPYLSGFYAKKRDIGREDLAGEFIGRMNNYAETMLRGTAKGYSTLTTNSLNLSVIHSNWDYSLMPVWVFSYRGKKKMHTYAMNGNTGKIWGALPVSVGKLVALGSAIAAAVGPLAATLYQLLFI